MGIFKNRTEAKEALEKEKLKNVELEYKKTQKLNEELEKELKKLQNEILTEDIQVKKEEKELTQEEMKEIFNKDNKYS